MSDLELVNVFNTLYILSCRVVILDGRYKVVFRNPATIAAIPIILGLINAFCGVLIFNERLNIFMSNVAQLSSLARFFAINFTAPVLGVLFLLDRHNISDMMQRIILFDEHFRKATNNWQTIVRLRLVRAQLKLIGIIYSLMIGFRLLICVLFFDKYGLCTTVMLISSLCLELQFCLQKVFVQSFAEHLTIRYQLLQHTLISNRPDRKRLIPSLKLYDRLISMQQLLANTFGVQLLLSTLMPFVSCAVVTYGSLHFLTLNVAVVHLVMEPIYVIPSIALFFGFAYQFDRLAGAEQEFKNAIKSLQYEATEEHSEDYLNFLDLINLKLMTESPKITACGLFTVNLQVFYNVFAAIVTYIMILFQFRDFEK
ncbi:uncharacterized protein LOC120418926 isoform X1 [Culex pipiens pallens]|uniref:uncharacterized protein LOC120418926 isoform X1 n=1 Tax=Culex pipiens pallens TaxID=42434 RepID=UPI0022AB1D34|nr:uncharacterized protein LOC120418926 isoform X1 [Culex pipiens pallens]